MAYGIAHIKVHFVEMFRVTNAEDTFIKIAGCFTLQMCSVGRSVNVPGGHSEVLESFRPFKFHGALTSGFYLNCL